MKDLYNHIVPTKVVAPIVGTNGAPPAAVADIDLAGFNSAVLCWEVGLEAGVLAAGLYWTLKLEHADDDGTGAAGAYANVAAADVLGVTPASGILWTVDAPAEDETVYYCGYVGGKRFLKVTIAETGATAGMPQSVLLIKGHGQDVPAIT
jgi:hypothetical protein